jgi:hypothetical protein
MKLRMAKLSDLILRSSEVTGVPLATVREVGRRLREDGLIQTGVGGRYGGAEMTAEHAAGLLTALMIVRAYSTSMRSVARLTRSHLKDLKSYYGRWNRVSALPQLCRLKPTHTFGDAFSSLLASVADGDLERATKKWTLYKTPVTGSSFELTVKIASPNPFPVAIIDFNTEAFGLLRMIYAPRRDKVTCEDWPRRWSEISDEPRNDLEVYATLCHPTLKAIGLLLRNSEEHA